MVEGDLVDIFGTDPINSTIANMPHPSSFFAQSKNRTSCTHIVKVNGLVATPLDGTICILQGHAKGQGCPLMNILGESEGNDLHRQLAGLFPPQVAPHAVSYQKQMALRLELCFISSRNSSQIVLVICTTHPGVGKMPILNGKCFHLNSFRVGIFFDIH